MDTEFKTLEVSREESFGSIEDLYKNILTEQKLKLRLPASLHSSGALGLEVAVIQLLGTWLRTGAYTKIFHSYQDANINDFKKLCESIYGLAALSLADEVWSKSGEKVPRGMALSNAAETIENLRNKKFEYSFKSHYFGVPCIKKPTYDQEFNVPIYNGNEVIESNAFFRQIKQIIDAKIGTPGRIEKLDDIVDIQDLSELLWELFKNTHDHGREAVNHSDLSLNFRGLIIQQQNIDDEYVERWCGKSPSQHQIQLRNSWRLRGQKHQVLDLSVVDFGEGFIKLANAKAGSPDTNEGKICTALKCFEEGWSRFPKRNRGSGLTKVLQGIQKYKGWLRIRTDNILIEKSFSESNEPKITRDDISVMENCVVGTAIHIALPLNRIGW
jgi:hypothetical protein